MNSGGLPLFLLMAFVCFSPPAYAEDPALKIQASPDQTSVKAGMMFLVHLRVVNSSGDTPADFWANSCSYEKHWMTDNAGVLIQSWTCNENTIENVTLEPGNAYEKNIILHIPQKDKTGPMTFRLGFKRMSENGDVAEPLWSDPITTHVIVPEEMRDSARSVADSVRDFAPREDTSAIATLDSSSDQNTESEHDVDPGLAPQIS